MKNTFLFVGLLGLLATCTPKISRTTSADLSADRFRFKAGQPPLISVHRGGGDLKGYPENCLESFAYVARQIGRPGAPAVIECDIDLTKDSVLVMMHDATLERTTTGTGKLIDRTYADVKTLKLEDNMGNPTAFRVPTLNQILTWGRAHVLFTLDVKRNVSFASVIDQVRQTKTENNVAIITYNAQDAALVHKLAPDLMISVTIRNPAEYDRLHELGIPDNRMLAFVGVKTPEASLYSFLHGKGISTILGTLGNLDKQAAAKGDGLYKEWTSAGADMLSTDRPLEVNRVLK
ncbi:glycerophosphodiester phosphodiesterase family protein [Fibrella sp. HMF5335]|uniref:Glycerophosphodiester phosphodiesterase family protein n=1 Tax=Fibrella rubiginis TaxID=2817060 RepID=A0A939GMR5_9BACT|nr:glycerophosphodiester phosphodiesterase family protein [Fibrella rubiginis]MBO0939651.1 glycerophosphodiester phosphodiesterase family protein [Fibrella rubiginis]